MVRWKISVTFLFCMLSSSSNFEFVFNLTYIFIISYNLYVVCEYIALRDTGNTIWCLKWLVEYNARHMGLVYSSCWWLPMNRIRILVWLRRDGNWRYIAEKWRGLLCAVLFATTPDLSWVYLNSLRRMHASTPHQQACFARVVSFLYRYIITINLIKLDLFRLANLWMFFIYFVIWK